jgi:hypothetical protein
VKLLDISTTQENCTLPHNIEEENGIMKNADTGKSKGI